MSDYKMVPVVASGPLLKAVRDAMPSQLGHGWPTGDDDAQRAYARILAAAPPFVVTDEALDVAAQRCYDAHMRIYGYSALWQDLKPRVQDYFRSMARAAIEAVLGEMK